MSDPALELRGIRAGYGAVEALRGVDLRVDAGEIVALVGANGAGKSTLIGTVFAAPQPRAGRVMLFGQDVTGWPTHRVARLGAAVSPEGRRVFARMTVAENLRLGAARRGAAAAAATEAMVLATFPRLAERRQQRAGLLSGGEQQMLAIGRALMAAPALLLLDEPSLGLAPLITRQIVATLQRLNAETGLAILLVEQNAAMALRVAHRGVVLANGAVELEGAAADLLANPRVRAAYLGGT